MIKQRDDNLTKEQELEMGRKIQAMIAIKEKMKNEEVELSKEETIILTEGEEALEILIGNHYNLARRIAHRNHQKTGTRYELEDLLQDSILALVEAAQTFDPDKNCKLSTHAHYGITKKVTSTINFQRIVRMPENKMGDYYSISQVQEAYKNLPDHKKEEYTNELEYVYEHVNISKEDIDIILQNMQSSVSLNAKVFDGEGELVDTLIDQNSAYEVVKYGNLDEKVIKVIDKLNDYERDLLALEYGVLPASMDYSDFKQKYKLSDKKMKLEINKLNRKMRKLGEKINKVS